MIESYYLEFRFVYYWIGLYWQHCPICEIVNDLVCMPSRTLLKLTPVKFWLGWGLQNKWWLKRQRIFLVYIYYTFKLQMRLSLNASIFSFLNRWLANACDVVKSIIYKTHFIIAWWAKYVNMYLKIKILILFQF